MQTIIIDEEFRSLLPGLDKKTFESLEESLINYGCLHPLTLWNGILIDGHYRYTICAKHDIPFDTIDLEFTSREAVLIWIISNQVLRRNLTPIQLSNCRGLHYRAERRIITNEDGRNQYSGAVEDDSQNGNQPQYKSTMSRLADQYKVSKNTIWRDAKISDAITAIGTASPVAKQRLLGGDVRLDKRILEELSSWPEDEITEIAAKIEDGTYENKRTRKPAEGETGPDDRTEPEVHPLCTVIINTMAEFSSRLRGYGPHSGQTEIKEELRGCITSLEELLQHG